MKIKCIVADDEPLARDGIENYIQKTKFLELTGSCKNAIETNSLLQQTKADLIFLDIQMPEITGLQWLKTLVEKPMIIITTAYREFAVEGFELDVTDYLVKPISYERFLKAVNKARSILEISENELYRFETDKNNEGGYFFIKNNQQLVKIFYADILYIEALKDYVTIYTESHKHLALISLKNVLDKLPATDFMRVHRSYVVAIKKVEIIEGNLIKIGSAEIPISRDVQELVLSRVVNKLLWKRDG